MCVEIREDVEWQKCVTQGLINLTITKDDKELSQR